MRCSVDTNVLVRAAVQDNEAQSKAAVKLLRESEIVALTLPCLCEFVWVLRSVYAYSSEQIGIALRALYAADNTRMERAAVEAGMAALASGGDFADGVIAYQGYSLGGEVFASFDQKAVRLLSRQGLATLLLR